MMRQQREFTRADHDINWFDEGRETVERRVKQIMTGGKLVGPS